MTGLHFTGCHIPACSLLSSRVHRVKDDKLTAHHTGYQASNDILWVLCLCMCICICMAVWKWESCHFWCFSKYHGLPVYGNVLEGRDERHTAPRVPTAAVIIELHVQRWMQDNIFLLSEIVILTRYRLHPFKCFSTWSRHYIFQERSSWGMLPHQHKSNNGPKYNGGGRYQFPRQQLWHIWGRQDR